MANKNIKGLTVEIGGDTTKLNDALKDVDSNGYKLQNNLKEVDRLLKLDPSNVELLAEKQKILSESVANSTEKLERLKSVQEQITQQYQNGEIDRGAYLAFKQELMTTEKQLDDFNDKLNDSGDAAKKSGVSMEALANGAKKAASAVGKISAASVKALTSAVNVGAKALTAYTGAITGAATAAFGLAANSAAMADDINTLSKVTGITTEQLQIYSMYSQQVDVSTETIAKSMQKLTKNMGDAAGGSATAAAKFEALGISVTDVNGNLRSNDEVFAEAIDKLGQIQNETERDAIAMDLFGKSAQELNPLILGGADAFREMGEAAKQNGLILSQEALDSLNAFNDSIDNLKTNVSAAGNILAGPFAPAFMEFTDLIGSSSVGIIKDIAAIFSGDAIDGTALTDKLTTFGQEFAVILTEQVPVFVEGFNTVILSVAQAVSETLPDTVMTLLPVFIDSCTNLISGLADNLPTLVPAIANGAVTLFTGIINGLNQVIAKLTPMLPGMVRDITAALTAAVPTLITGAVAFFTGIIQGLAQALPDIIQGVVDLIPVICNELINSIPLIIDAGLQLFTALVEALPDAIVTIVAALPDIITNIISTLAEAIPLMIQAGIDLLVALVDALPEIITNIVAAIPKIITSIVVAITTSIPQLIKAGIDLFLGLIGALPDIIIALVDALPQIIEGIINGLIEAAPQINQAGVELFTALVTDLPKIIIELVKVIPKIIKGLIDSFKKHISNMQDIGKELMSGIGEGLINGVTAVKDKINAAGDKIMSAFKEFFGIQSPSRLFRDEVGTYLAQGIGVGFTGEMSRVTKQMQAALPTKFDTDVTIGGNLQSAAKNAADSGAYGGNNNSFVQNIYSPKALSRAEIAANTRSLLQLANVR